MKDLLWYPPAPTDGSNRSWPSFVFLVQIGPRALESDVLGLNRIAGLISLGVLGDVFLCHSVFRQFTAFRGGDGLLEPWRLVSPSSLACSGRVFELINLPFPHFGGKYYRCRAGGNNLDGFKNFRTENGSSQGQNMALTGSFVPSSLDSGFRDQILCASLYSCRSCPPSLKLRQSPSFLKIDPTQAVVSLHGSKVA